MFAADLENPWIVAARQAPRRAPVAMVAVVAVVTAGTLLFARRALGPLAGQPLAELVVVAGLALAAAIATRLEGRRVWPRETYGLAAIVGGLALGLGAVFACAAVASIAGAAGILVGPPVLPAGVLAAGLAVAALGAAAQEMFFRGWIQPALCAAWGAWPGLLATAVAFTGFHVAAGAHGTFAVFNLFLAGLLFGVLALRSGGLAAPTAAHLVWTWTGFAGLAASPASLVQVRLWGPAIWSGGDQGLAGSLAATAVLLVLLASLLTVKPQVPAPTRPRP